MKDVPACRDENVTDEDVEHTDGEACLKMITHYNFQSFHSKHPIPLSLDTRATDLIWGQTTEAYGEEGHEAEVEGIKERPGLDSGHEHSAAGYIAGDRKG